MIVILPAAASLLLLASTGVDAQAQPVPAQHAFHAPASDDRAANASTGTPFAGKGESPYYDADRRGTHGSNAQPVFREHLEEQGERHVQHESSSSSPMKPKIYGLKTVGLALIGIIAMLIWSVYIQKSLGSDVKDLLVSDKEGLDAAAEIGKNVGKYLLTPFPSLSHPGAMTYMGSLIFLLSGLYAFFLSVRRRSKFKRGEPVRGEVPLMGTFFFPISFLMVLVSGFLIYYTSLMSALGFMWVGLSIWFASTILMGLSSMDRMM